MHRFRLPVNIPSRQEPEASVAQAGLRLHSPNHAGLGIGAEGPEAPEWPVGAVGTRTGGHTNGRATRTGGQHERV